MCASIASAGLIASSGFAWRSTSLRRTQPAQECAPPLEAMCRFVRWWGANCTVLDAAGDASLQVNAQPRGRSGIRKKPDR